MKKLKTRVATGHGSRFLTFWCPGCKGVHSCRVRDESGQRPSWDWNRDKDRPTLNPSVLSTGKKTLSEDEITRIQSGEAVEVPDQRCHLFLKDGRLQFLADCTHELAGQTVDLPDLPNWLQDE